MSRAGQAKLGLALIVLAISLWLTGLELQRRWNTPLAIPAGGYHLNIPPGSTLGSVTARLEEQGIIPYPRLLLFYGRWSGMDKKIKQGEYILPQYLSVKPLLILLSEGKVIQYQLTLPEGITLARALEVLAGESSLERILSGPDDARILDLIAPHSEGEGLFFPDSYHYVRGTTDWQILQRSYHRMQTILTQEWSSKAPGLPIESPYQALILASIIERETGQPAERTEISGVFTRRLQKRMRLQTDPAVIYGLGDRFTGNLRRVHLKDESNPYNTYRHHGLPPTPIALPGREAIHAALNPAEGDTLFFVARGDGGHEFSATLQDHEKAVRKYQLQRRADYRSNPERQ